MPYNPYEQITDLIIQKLEEGVVPWRRPWNTHSGLPMNLISKKAYRGMNVFWLWCAGYESPYWLTFRQAKRLGGSVRKGEKGFKVTFWKWPDSKKPIEEVDEETGETKFRRPAPILKVYTVFNTAQCDLPEGKVPDFEATKNDHEAIEEASAIITGMPNPPRIETGMNRASYSPSEDLVRLPALETFGEAEEFYSTAFHELTHSTGHSSRLDRLNMGEDVVHKGDEDYSKEELVAEMGAAFLCGESGILVKTIDNSAAYLDNWIKRLKGDSRLAITAAAQAQKAADFILDRQFATEES